jgi:Flp pilus assembly protein TadG
LVVMIFFTMLFGIVDFGRALYAYHFVSNAARTAARWAAVNGSACSGDGSCTAPVSCSGGSCTPCTSGCAAAGATDVQNYVTMLAQGANIDSSSNGCAGSPCLSTMATWQAPQWTDLSQNPCAAPLTSPGCEVEVQVKYNFNFLVPFVHSGTVPLSSTSQMIIAH